MLCEYLWLLGACWLGHGHACSGEIALTHNFYETGRLEHAELKIVVHYMATRLRKELILWASDTTLY
jgi:hypothetical protein